MKWKITLYSFIAAALAALFWVISTRPTIVDPLKTVIATPIFAENLIGLLLLTTTILTLAFATLAALNGYHYIISILAK